MYAYSSKGVYLGDSSHSGTIDIKNDITKEEGYVEYNFTYDQLTISGFSMNCLIDSKYNNFRRSAKYVEPYRKLIEKVTITHAGKEIPEEEQRRFITMLINLFEPEDTGLTKRAL